MPLGVLVQWCCVSGTVACIVQYWLVDKVPHVLLPVCRRVYLVVLYHWYCLQHGRVYSWVMMYRIYYFLYAGV